MKTQTAILGNNRINLAELAQAIWMEIEEDLLLEKLLQNCQMED